MRAQELDRIFGRSCPRLIGRAGTAPAPGHCRSGPKLGKAVSHALGINDRPGLIPRRVIVTPLPQVGITEDEHDEVGLAVGIDYQTSISPADLKSVMERAIELPKRGVQGTASPHPARRSSAGRTT